MTEKLRIKEFVRIKSNTVNVGSQTLFQEPVQLAFAPFAKKLYYHLKSDYAKFFKMDDLSKLGFLATEFLFKKSDLTKYEKKEMAIVFSNRSASLFTDMNHQRMIETEENYPSPAVFVYTLPNIVTGEISIRNGIKGENAFFIFDTFTPQILENYSRTLLNSSITQNVLCGWLEYNEQDYEAFLFVLNLKDGMEYTKEKINELYYE